jgi:hypothetical protein
VATDPGDGPTLVLLDADTVAGWRRVKPSLSQLRRATADLIDQHPEVKVAVVADPSIKWALDDDEQDAFEEAIVDRSVVCAPAGTSDGTDGWVAAIVDRARRNGEEVVIVTDRAVTGVPVARLSHTDGRFGFDLAGAREIEARATPQWRRRRR